MSRRERDTTVEAALLGLRVSIALVFALWIGQLIQVQRLNEASVFDTPDHFKYAIFGAMLIVVLCFAIGAFKTISYGALLCLQTWIMIASLPFGQFGYHFLFVPWHSDYPENWVVLAALFAVFVLRDRDRLMSL